MINLFNNKFFKLDRLENLYYCLIEKCFLNLNKIIKMKTIIVIGAGIVGVYQLQFGFKEVVLKLLL